jgi:hypothetical protein
MKTVKSWYLNALRSFAKFHNKGASVVGSNCHLAPLHINSEHYVML